MFTASLTL